MKYFILILIAFLIGSCGRNKSSHLEYSYAANGLIYKFGSNELYTGKIKDTSNVIIEFEVVKGVKHGKFITHYLNGTIEKVGFIDNNFNEGIWNYYYSNGQIESSGRFKRNKAEGLWKSYFPDGKLKCEGKYKEGRQDGYWYHYDNQGKLIGYWFYRDIVTKNLLFKQI